MVAASSSKESSDLPGYMNINKFGIKKLLKSAAIFGANGSGKTNLVHALVLFREIVLGSLDSVERYPVDVVIPFLLNKKEADTPTEFEVSFLAEGNLYRYGISVLDGVVEEEWLFWIKSSRETMLFQRVGQTVQYNASSFSEAKLFVKKVGDEIVLEKTKPQVPFVTVLSQFEGEKSSIVSNWFKKLNIISGLRESGFKKFTVELFDSDPEFKEWALNILKSIQIDDLSIVEAEKEIPLRDPKKPLEDQELKDVLSKIKGYLEKNKIKEKKIEIVKYGGDGKAYNFPLNMESEGTRKLIYLLGPLYDVINNNEILVVDEFDNKFHTLLCRFIIDLYNKFNVGCSQLVLTLHDTNLLTGELFRRDQIWFMEKNEHHESELFSLVEYRENYARKGKDYSRDYLAGKYGAIPLFRSSEELGEFFRG